MDLFIVKISKYDGKHQSDGGSKYFSTLDKAEKHLTDSEFKKGENPWLLKGGELSHWTKDYFETATLTQKEIDKD